MTTRARHRLALAVPAIFTVAAGACVKSTESNLDPPDAGLPDVTLPAPTSDAGGPLPDGSLRDAATSDAPSPPDATAISDAPGATDATATDVGVTRDAGDPDGAVNLGAVLGTVLYSAASNDGTAMVLATDTSGRTMQFTQYEPGLGWSAPASVPSATGWTSDTRPALGMDATGNAFLAWLTVPGGLHGLRVARYDHATHAWGAAQQPDPYALGLGGFLAMSVNAAGEAMILVMHQGATGEHNVYAHHYAGGSWTPEVVAAQPSTAHGAPLAVRLADNGGAVALWTLGLAGDLVATRSGSTWTAGPALSTLPGGAPADVAIDSAGNVTVGFDANGTPQVYQYSATTTTWSGATKVNAVANGGVSCGVTVALAPTTGDGVLTRCTNTSNVISVESYAYAKSSATWGTATPITTVDRMTGIMSVYDSALDGFAIWETSTSLGQSAPVVFARYGKVVGWSSQSTPLGGAATGLTAMMSPGGAGWVSWSEGTSLFAQRVP